MLQQGQQHPCTDPQLRPLDVWHLLVDHQLLNRACGAPERLRPVRHAVARLDQGGKLGLVGQSVVGHLERTRIGAVPLCLLWKFDALVGGRTAGDHRRHIGGGVEVEQRRQRPGPPEVDVGVMFPGETDPAEQLDVLLGATPSSGKRLRRGDGTGECALGTVAAGAGGVPRNGGSKLDIDEHVGEVVFDGLERSDCASELLADFGVLGGHLKRCRGDTSCLGGGQAAGDRDRRVRTATDHVGCFDGGTVEGQSRNPASLVNAVDRLGDQLWRGEYSKVIAATHDHDLGMRSAEHEARRSGQRTVSRKRRRATERDRTQRRTVGETGQVGGALSVRSKCVDHSRAGNGRQERPRRSGATDRFEHDHQFGESEP